LLLQGLDPIRDIINSRLVGRRWQAGQDGFLNLRLKLRLKLLKPLRRIRLSSTGSGIPSQGSPLHHGSGGAAPAAFWAEHSAMVAGLATGPLWRVITMSPWLIASSLAGDVQPCLPLDAYGCRVGLAKVIQSLMLHARNPDHCIIIMDGSGIQGPWFSIDACSTSGFPTAERQGKLGREC
jgi:hypothetical protein